MNFFKKTNTGNVFKNLNNLVYQQKNLRFKYFFFKFLKFLRNKFFKFQKKIFKLLRIFSSFFQFFSFLNFSAMDFFNVENFGF